MTVQELIAKKPETRTWGLLAWSDMAVEMLRQQAEQIETTEQGAKAMTKELLQQALDALAFAYNDCESDFVRDEKIDPSMKAIEQALAQQEQGSPALGGMTPLEFLGGGLYDFQQATGFDTAEQFLADKAQQEQPAQKPFCMHWEDRWGCNHYADKKEPHPSNAKPLYTHPAPTQPALSDLFAALDAVYQADHVAWKELCEKSAKLGITHIPITPAHADLLEKSNRARELFEDYKKAHCRGGAK